MSDDVDRASLYDPACRTLAEHFLAARRPVSPLVVDALAFKFQQDAEWFVSEVEAGGLLRDAKDDGAPVTEEPT
jgi:hypothetical protein